MHVNCFSRVPAPRVPKVILCGLAVTAIFLLPDHVSAQTSLEASGFTADYQGHINGPDSGTSGTGPVTSAFQHDYTFSQAVGNYSNGNGEGDLKSSADYGILKTYAHATSSALDGVPGFVTVAAQSSAKFQDNLFVDSSQFAVGTSVELRFNFAVDGNFSLSSTTAAEVDANIGFAGQDNGNPLFSQNTTKGGGLGEGGINKNDPPPVFVQSAVGDVIHLDAGMFSNAVAEPQVNFDTESATANYYDTAHFYADSLTPGVSLVSASGHDYSSPVPEASTCLSFGGLLLGLGGMMLRARKRSRG